MNRRKMTMIFAALAMLVLILDTRCAMAAASEGVELCIRTVIPSLFPFFLVSILLTQSAARISVLRPLGAVFRISPGAQGLLVPGLLGGYPVGAQAVAQAVRNRAISPEEGNRLLSFCSQAGPAFIFGIAGNLFPSPHYGWLLWGVQVLSAWGVSLFRKPTGTGCASPTEGKSISLSEALRKAVRIMAEVCGWIILFRVVLGFFNRWFLWLLPPAGRVLTAGLLELTNGCFVLGEITSVPLRFILCACMLNFGGLCVAMQTLSVTEGLEFWNYLIGKLLQTLICLGLCAAVFFPRETFLPGLLAVSVSVFALFPKRSGNSATVGV